MQLARTVHLRLQHNTWQELIREQRSKVTLRLGSLSASSSSEESLHNQGFCCNLSSLSDLSTPSKLTSDVAKKLLEILQILKNVLLSFSLASIWWLIVWPPSLVQVQTSGGASPGENAAARGWMLCVRLTRDDILHPSDGSTIHHNENLHLRLVNHKRPSARATVRKQTKQRRQSASPAIFHVCLQPFQKRMECLFVCLCLHGLDDARSSLFMLLIVFACHLLRLELVFFLE